VNTVTWLHHLAVDLNSYWCRSGGIPPSCLLHLSQIFIIIL